MTSDESEPKLVGRGHVEKLKGFGARAVTLVDHAVFRLRDGLSELIRGGTATDFYREVSETSLRERADAAERVRQVGLATDVADEAPLTSSQLPALMGQNTDSGPRLSLPYFGIEHFKPNQIAQLFAEGVEPQPFDPALSYRIRSYAPPVGTMLYFVFERINKALGPGQQPVRLLLLQPVRTASGDEVPNVQSGMPITTVCVYLSKATPWMEIRPLGPRIREAGVEAGQPAVIKIKPPDLEKGRPEPYVVFLHDRRRPVRLGVLLENEYMDGKSAICPLSEVAKNYFEAQNLPLLARLPEPEPVNSSRPPVYEPFPVKAQSPPRARRVQVVVIPNAEPAALPPPKPEEKGNRRRRRKAPPLESMAVISVEGEEGPVVPQITH